MRREKGLTPMPFGCFYLHMEEAFKGNSEHQVQQRVRWTNLFGFSLPVLGLWITEYYSPQFDLIQVIVVTTLMVVLGILTTRRTLRLCDHLESAVRDQREKNQRLREKTALLESNRRKLLELDHLKSDFVSMVSHELRTPLTSIIGFARTLQTLPLGAAQHKKYLGIIEAEGKRLAEMVEEYLDVSKIEAGTLSLRLTTIDIQRLIQEVAEPLHLSSHVRIETRIDPTVPTLIGDQDRLKRVLLNLLANAVRYTAEGTAVEVSASSEDHGICFRVKDHGPGLTLHAQECVFDRFYRGTDAITERTRGSGLGLPIAKAVVEKHGGRIWVESEPGQGATFLFWLPLQPPGSQPAVPAGNRAAPPGFDEEET